MLAYLMVGLAPFRFDLPHRVNFGGAWSTTPNDDRVWKTDGEHPSRVGGPSWVGEARRARQFEVAVSIWTDDLDQRGIILTSGKNRDNANLILEQRGAKLRVRLRGNSFPLQVDVDDVFQRATTRRLVIRRTGSRVTLRSEGRQLFKRDLSEDAVRRWDAGYPTYLGATGDGANAWSGTFSEASVRAGGDDLDELSVDLLANLDGTGGHLYFPPLPEQLSIDLTVVVDFFRNFFGFLPFGAAAAFLLRSRRPLVPALLGLALTLTIEGGQIFLPGRFAHVLDVTLNAAGGLVGAWLFLRLVPPKKPKRSRRSSEVRARSRTPAASPQFSGGRG